MNHPSLRRAVYVGSFDPFHAGHANIVERALRLFDEVVVGVSVNEKKTPSMTIEERVESIKARYRSEPRVVVTANHGLTIDFARQCAACCIVKGVRDGDDFENEWRQARWNREHGGVETVVFFADSALKNLRSSDLRAKINNDGE